MTDWPEAPPTQVRNIGILQTSAWLWNWIPPIFPNSAKVRPSDLDGWVEQGGQLLMLDGCYGPQGRANKPSMAIHKTVKRAKNVTYLALSTDDEPTLEVFPPQTISHYCLLPGSGWNPPSYQWGGRWWPLSPTDGKWEAVAIMAQWAAWAVYQNGRQP